MATKTLIDIDSVQTLTNKTLTAPTITAAVVSLAAAPSATLDAATKGYVDGLNVNPLNNGSMMATVAANAITFHLKTAGGSTPSSGDPVRVTFRNSTDADGSLVTRTVTGTTTMTCASGSTLGMTSGVMGRLWVGLLDNGGTVEVCAWNPLSTSGSPAQLSLKAFTPNSDVSTTAEGSGTATSAHILYSTNARSAVPFVLLGFVEISEATAGVWATAPSVVQTSRDGMRKTGDLIQCQSVSTGAVATGTTVTNNDDTIPQNTEGDQYLSQAIIPTSAVNLLVVRSQAFVSHSISGIIMQIALFQDSTANALQAAELFVSSNVVPSTLNLSHRLLAGTASAMTFKIRLGASAAGTTTFNGASGARLLGGVAGSYLAVDEVYV